MQVWMFASEVQVDDNAPRGEDLEILYRKFAMVGEIVDPYPTVDVDVKDVSISKEGRIGLEGIGDKQYRITGEILDGYLYTAYCGRNIVYLVVDAGFLLRLAINVPLKYVRMKTGSVSRCVPLTLTEEDGPRSIRFSKGDLITFPAEIWAMWTDMWGSAVEVSFRGKIVDREINEDHSMWLLLEPLPSKKEYWLDTKHRRLSEGDIVIEYPTRN